MSAVVGEGWKHAAPWFGVSCQQLTVMSLPTMLCVPPYCVVRFLAMSVTSSKQMFSTQLKNAMKRKIYAEAGVPLSKKSLEPRKRSSAASVSAAGAVSDCGVICDVVEVFC